MKHSKNENFKEYSEGIRIPSEQLRTTVLSMGYDFIKWKSKIKKFFRESYVFAEGTEKYTNIPLRTVDGPRGKRSI